MLVKLIIFSVQQSDLMFKSRRCWCVYRGNYSLETTVSETQEKTDKTGDKLNQEEFVRYRNL